ncbi:MAG: PAS domain-containing protein, partial [Bacteroidota bacterium]|nr:PAS domain-containing protein [Bacteroidota bacterium]
MKKIRLISSIISIAIIYILLFIGIEIFHKKQINQHIEEYTKELKIKYNVVNNSNLIIAETVLHFAINKSEVLKIFSKAYKANSIQKKILRDSLYNMLKLDYEFLKSKNFKQVHFHLPNNESFLRFHKPNKFGDNLSDIRYSVKMTNSKLQKQIGFEEGRIFNGFRQVFPLFYKDKHIGSVETSFSFGALMQQFKEQYKNDIFGFIIKKDVVETKVWDNEKSNYSSSLLSDKYLHEKKFLHYNNENRKELKKLDRKIKNKIKVKISTNSDFTIYQKIEDNYFAISFISVKNVEGIPTAYIFTYHKDNVIAKYNLQYYIMHVLVFIIFIIIGLSIFIIQSKNQKIKESEIKYRTITDFNHDWEYWVDENWNFIYASPSCEKITGYKPEDFLNNKYFLIEIIHPDDKILVQNHRHDIDENGERKAIEFRIIKKNKEVRWISHVCLNVFSPTGEKLGIRGSNRDITEQKLAEQALKESEYKLREINETKDKFFSIIAHDLKNPFTSMLGFSSLLNDNFDNFATEKKKRFIYVINEGLQNTFKLLENLLYWSRMQRGTIEFNPEKLNLYLVSEKTIELLYQSAKEKSI